MLQEPKPAHGIGATAVLEFQLLKCPPRVHFSLASMTLPNLTWGQHIRHIDRAFRRPCNSFRETAKQFKGPISKRVSVNQMGSFGVVCHCLEKNVEHPNLEIGRLFGWLLPFMFKHARGRKHRACRAWHRVSRRPGNKVNT